VYLAPFIHGMRYTSFGRHFTKKEKLNEVHLYPLLKALQLHDKWEPLTLAFSNISRSVL